MSEPESLDDLAAARLRKMQAPPEPANIGASDDDLALRFSARHAADLRYIASWDRWLVWDGKRWHRDERRLVFDLARKVCREGLAEALASGMLTDAQQRSVRQRFGSAQTVWSVVKLAGTDPRHAITSDQLDADPWQLNTPAGIVDLRTGKVGPHDPAALCSKITAAAPGSACPLWLTTLERVLPDPAERAYLARLFGYALTGLVREHVLPFPYGPGANGKGTTLHAMRYAMGEYGLEVGAELLTESHNDRHLCEIAVLHGARLVIGSEIASGKRWNESLLKRLTGGDPISARFIGRDLFEFEPTHLLMVMANTKPSFRAIDEAIRRRIHLIDFSVIIPKAERDPELPEKLKAEADGILAWAIAGCLDWQAQGLNPPESIMASSAAYLDGEDNIAAWLSECCQRKGQFKLTEAHKNYRKWCDSAGALPLGRNTFGDQMLAHGIARQEIPRSGVVLLQDLSPIDGYGQNWASDD